MLWLETVLFGAVAIAALVWAALSAYILGVCSAGATPPARPCVALARSSRSGTTAGGSAVSRASAARQSKPRSS